MNQKLNPLSLIALFAFIFILLFGTRMTYTVGPGEKAVVFHRFGKGLDKENVHCFIDDTEVPVKECDDELHGESDEEYIIQEESQPENKTKNTTEIENKVKADKEDVDSTKDALKDESQAEDPQLKNKEETKLSETKKSAAKLNKDRANTDSDVESTNKSEEVNKTKS